MGVWETEAIRDPPWPGYEEDATGRRIKPTFSNQF